MSARLAPYLQSHLGVSILPRWPRCRMFPHYTPIYSIHSRAYRSTSTNYSANKETIISSANNSHTGVAEGVTVEEVVQPTARQLLMHSATSAVPMIGE